jgi:hypothetical protein
MSAYPSANRCVAVAELDCMYYVEGRASNSNGILNIDAARLIKMPDSIVPFPMRFFMTGIVQTKEDLPQAGESEIHFAVKSYSRGNSSNQNVSAKFNRAQYQKVK